MWRCFSLQALADLSPDLQFLLERSVRLQPETAT